MWRQWVQLKLQHHQVPTAMELEGDLKLWSHLASWPSFNNSNWDSEEDYGLGLPISMVIPEFFLQSQIQGGNVSTNFCDSLDMQGLEDKRCVVQRPKTKWYLNTFHKCIQDRLKDDHNATFDYLSYEQNAEDIDSTVLEEADAILTRVLYEVVDPIVQYEDSRYIVQSTEDEFVEVEAVEGEGTELFTDQDREVIPEEVDPLDEGVKLYNLADEFQPEQEAAIEAVVPVPSPVDRAYETALKRVQKIIDRAYLIQASRRSGWRFDWNVRNWRSSFGF